MDKVYIGDILNFELKMSENEHWKLISLKLPEKMLNEWENYSKAKSLKRSEFIRLCVNDVIHSDDQFGEFYTNLILKLQSMEKSILRKLQKLDEKISSVQDGK